MPRKKDAKVIGRCECQQCGGTMAVLQNTRHYLYTQCGECGCDQRNGAKHQSYLWYNTRWLDGEPEHKPINLIDKEPVPEPEAPVPGPKCTGSDEEDSGSGWGWLLVPFGILAALVLRGS